MKKVLALLMTLLTGSVALAASVDDFDSYDISSTTTLADVTTNWTGLGGTPEIIDDGTGNQVLTWGNASGGSGAYNNTISIPDTSTAATLFARIYVNSEDVDHSFGLSDLSAPTWFDSFECQLAFIRNSGGLTDGLIDFKIRKSGTTTTIESISVGQWYDLWIVVHQSTDTFDVYLKSENSTATDIAELGNGFRNGTTSDIVSVLGLCYNATVRGIYVDEVYFSEREDLSLPILKAYNPEVSQVVTADGQHVDVTLNWKAGLDPEGTYAVNPDIVSEYVFIGKTSDDPNIYYEGTLGDPGVADQVSEYLFTGDFDSEYSWVVVEGMTGISQAFSTGDTLDDITDPNAIVGSVWKFSTPLSSATISTQPADVRAFDTDASATFALAFNSSVNPVVGVDWYKDGALLTMGGDLSSTFTSELGDGTASLTIATPGASDEGKYYCILNTEADPAVISDDSQSATRLLVIKKLLSQYTFDNAADPLEDTGDLAAEVGVSRDAAVVKEATTTPDSETATTVAPTVLADGGISGSALYLNGNEFVDLSPAGYPCAGYLDTLGDIRGSGYEKQGFGRGMDEGSILCWVKLESDGVVFSNANIDDGTHFAVSTNGADSARIIVRGENWDGGSQNLGEANGSYSFLEGFDLQGGQWDMFAATWDNSTARIYINGEMVATNSQGFTEVYVPWDYGNLIGVSRLGQPDRNLLNAADFITGAIDELRIYNYAISSSDIAAEYAQLNTLGITPCMNHDFVGSVANLDNSANSYCVVDLYDFAIMATNWLSDGFSEDAVE